MQSRLGSTDLGSPLQGRKQQDRPEWRTSGCFLMRQWPPLPAHREHLCWAAPQWSRQCSCDPAGSAIVTLRAAQTQSCCCGLRGRLVGCDTVQAAQVAVLHQGSSSSLGGADPGCKATRLWHWLSRRRRGELLPSNMALAPSRQVKARGAAAMHQASGASTWQGRQT